MSIEVLNVSKSFKEVQALQNVSLTFEENAIYGLLGRNGAGKSTLLNIISNRIFADGGQVLLDGKKVAENDALLSQIYLMSEKTYYPSWMKVKKALRWAKSFYPNFDEAYAFRMAEAFGLSLNAKMKGLSTGYSSIFKLVVALSVNVPYVFLDEPVLGLDANHRDLFYRMLLEKYTGNPFTIVISTHLIEEVSGLVEEVVIIKNGSVLRSQSREELLGGGYTISGTAALVDAYIAGREVLGQESLGGLKTAYLLGRASKEELPEGLEISGLDLQKLFIRLTDS